MAVVECLCPDGVKPSDRLKAREGGILLPWLSCPASPYGELVRLDGLGSETTFGADDLPASSRLLVPRVFADRGAAGVGVDGTHLAVQAADAAPRAVLVHR